MFAQALVMNLRITDKPMIEENPLLGGIPEVAQLQDKVIRYIVLVYDYDSPYKKFPLDERKRRVAERVGFLKEKDGKRFDKNYREILNDNNDRVLKGIAAFKETMFDEDKEMLASLRGLIHNIRSEIATPSSDVAILEKKAKLAAMLPNLAKNKQELVKILEITDEIQPQQAEEQQVDELSTLEALNEGLISNSL
jgi:hypothetical protein